MNAKENKKLALRLGIQTYEILTSNDEVCIQRIYSRAVVSRGAGGALAPPEFGSSVNPIPTRGGTLCPSHYR